MMQQYLLHVSRVHSTFELLILLFSCNSTNVLHFLLTSQLSCCNSLLTLHSLELKLRTRQYSFQLLYTHQSTIPRPGSCMSP